MVPKVCVFQPKRYVIARCRGGLLRSPPLVVGSWGECAELVCEPLSRRRIIAQGAVYQAWASQREVQQFIEGLNEVERELGPAASAKYGSWTAPMRCAATSFSRRSTQSACWWPMQSPPRRLAGLLALPVHAAESFVESSPPVALPLEFGPVPATGPRYVEVCVLEVPLEVVGNSVNPEP